MKKLIPVFIILLFISCKQDILDISPQDRISENAVWSDVNLIKAYQNSLYNAIPHGFYIHMYSKYTDEAYDSAPCCGADIFARNTFTPENITAVSGGDFWGGYMYYWDHGYQYIRRINVFLEKMQGDDIQFEEKKRLVAETKFLRAFIYFKLIKRYGGVPIVKKAYDLGDDVQFKRSTFDECVAFINQDLSDAISDLPARYPSTDPNYGRATADAAKALRSRMFLYAASPLFNPSNDKQKWQKAADAAAALIGDEGGVDYYELYPDYQKLFELKTGEAQKEVIFARGFTSSNGHEAPMNNLNRRYGAYGGWWGSNGPTQNLVDDYDMTNGEQPFLKDGSINPNSGYDPQNPYKNRDPRLNATIIHDGSTFRGDTLEMWVAEDGSQWGKDSYKESGDNPRTNYVLKKFMPTEGPLSWDHTFTIEWPHFRLAEIYLNYAEAEFELGNEAKAREYVNKVRSRPSVNLPDIPSTVTGEDLRRRIYNERRVELAFEGQRFFDIRRWKIGGVVENRPIRGMDIAKNMSTKNKTYTPVKLLQKKPWEEKMNLLPIAQDEIRRNPELTQTPGW